MRFQHRPESPATAMYRIEMRISCSQNVRLCFAVAFVLCCFGFTSTSVWPQADKPAASGEKGGRRESAAEKTALPPLPADAHVPQEIKLDGKPLKYTVTVSAMPVRDKDGKVAGQVVTTAYTVEGENRPVTFALNGGPGAASVYLNFGAIGPKHMNAGNEGDSPSDPGVLTDNPGHLARLHRPGIHRSDRHGVQPLRGSRGPGEKALLLDHARHSISVARDLRLAGEERAPRLAQVSRGRELRRIPRAAHHALPAVAAGRGVERRGAGVAVSEPGRGRATATCRRCRG